MDKIVKTTILGTGISNASADDILEYVEAKLARNGSSFYIVTPNPEIVTFATKHKDFQLILNQAQLALCDGVGLVWAAKILGTPLKERLTGVDFIREICKRSVRKPVSIGFLGGKAGVAEKAAECLRKEYPELNITFVGEEWREEKRAVIDILFVAFGFPKQERWMAEHLDKGIYRVAIGVGGAFDYLSGNVSRAPKSMRELGLEWLYRLIRQPWRAKRQIALIEFIWHVFKERFNNRNTH